MDAMLVISREDSIHGRFSFVPFIEPADCAHRATMCLDCESTWSIDYVLDGVHHITVTSVAVTSAGTVDIETQIEFCD